MSKLLILALVVSGSSAFAAEIRDQIAFDNATKGLSTIPVSEKQCQAHVTDKIRGYDFDTDKFDVVTSAEKSKRAYLSVWRFNLGEDQGNNLFISIDPYKDSFGKLLIELIIDNDPSDIGTTGGEEEIQVFGAQASGNQVEIHGSQSNVFGRGKAFDSSGTFENGKFSTQGETRELKYSVTCDFGI